MGEDAVGQEPALHVAGEDVKVPVPELPLGVVELSQGLFPAVGFQVSHGLFHHGHGFGFGAFIRRQGRVQAPGQNHQAHQGR